MMDISPSTESILQTPGVLMLPGNRVFSIAAGASSAAGGVTCRRLDTGHLVFDGPLGRRMLLTDPDGHPLHECDWDDAGGTVRLASARWYLDWGQWVGLKPGGLARTTTLDLTTRPGWRALTRRDLRAMAARAMHVDTEAVEFFYADDDLTIQPDGRAVIRQRKDALFVLDDGAFERARFMSCMTAMRWADIDYLPVVELFQSLLPGTGSAAFEFIRGLYDDQRRSAARPRPLRYRGIPAYPSAGAFGLFSNFFTPGHPGPESPMAVFMDARRSHEVEWLPAPHPPVRYVAPRHRLCLTVRDGAARKATVPDDADGIPFVPPDPRGFAPGGKRLTVRDGRLCLSDHRTSREIPLDRGWGVTRGADDAGAAADAGAVDAGAADTGAAADTGVTVDAGVTTDAGGTPDAGGRGGGSWEDLFPDGSPPVSPKDACSAVLLYPDDETVIGDLASQPFVADFWHDLAERDPSLAACVRRADRVLIHGFDACVGGLPVDDPGSTTILYTHDAHARKQAQGLWNQRARRRGGRDIERSAGRDIERAAESNGIHRFVSERSGRREAYRALYDLLFVWLPFAVFDDTDEIREHLRRITGALRPDGLAWVAGPDNVAALMPAPEMETLSREPVSMLPPFRLHQSILPRATLHPRLHAWILRRR